METIKSPCIDVCSLDENDLCIGCKRSVQEIADWRDFSNAEKLQVLERVRQRYAAARNPT